MLHQAVVLSPLDGAMPSLCSWLVHHSSRWLGQRPARQHRQLHLCQAGVMHLLRGEGERLTVCHGSTNNCTGFMMADAGLLRLAGF